MSVRNSYLSTFPDDNADIFAAAQLISYGSFSSLILLAIVKISFYILSVSISILSIKSTLIIESNFMKFLFVWNFHNKIVRIIWPFGTPK